jgi:hypothetical protein
MMSFITDTAFDRHAPSVRQMFSPNRPSYPPVRRVKKRIFIFMPEFQPAPLQFDSRDALA